MKRNLSYAFLNLILCLSFSAGARGPSAPKDMPPAVLKYDPLVIFKFVLEAKRKELNTSIPMPEIYYESQISLTQFQDAVEPQWGFRPDVVTNVFVSHLNQIYLLDDAEYYSHTKRCMDDSLAHELTHYVQDKYQHFDLNDDSLEAEAVDVQTQFREKFCPVKK